MAHLLKNVIIIQSLLKAPQTTQFRMFASRRKKTKTHSNNCLRIFRFFAEGQLCETSRGHGTPSPTPPKSLLPPPPTSSYPLAHLDRSFSAKVKFRFRVKSCFGRNFWAGNEKSERWHGKVNLKMVKLRENWSQQLTR